MATWVAVWVTAKDVPLLEGKWMFHNLIIYNLIGVFVMCKCHAGLVHTQRGQKSNMPKLQGV